MRPLQRLTLAEQVALRLRGDLQEGRWCGMLPGVEKLAVEMDVSRPTMRAALRLLENEGLIGARGIGRSRTVSGLAGNKRVMRVGIVSYAPYWSDTSDTLRVLLEIRHHLETAGDEVFLLGKSQAEMRYDVRRVKVLMQETPADAWIVVAGSRELLEWCAMHTVPTMALYGRTGGLKLARTGPDKMDAYRNVARRLIALGHRNIVLLCPSMRRKPTLGALERVFLDEMESHGIATGEYNLPDWRETPEDFHRLLVSLFRATPPTALVIEETPRVVAVLQFLAQQRIEVPRQVSLVSTDYDSSLDWCVPGIAHMRWDNSRIVRRIVRWVNAVRQGRADRRTINFPVEFVDGGSIAPVCRKI